MAKLDAQWADDWNDLIMCREVYHCTPRELEEQDEHTVAIHRTMLAVEAEASRWSRM